MTVGEARLKISVHSGKTEDFYNGYRYALKYGFHDLEDMIHKFDEIFICLKTLKKESCFIKFDKELFEELSEILWGSILYINSQAPHYHMIGIHAEVLSETILYLLENVENPFVAFDNYKENYDII